MTMRVFKSVATLLLALVLARGVRADTYRKADNADNLNLGSSWVGGVAPGSADVGLWDNTVTGANTVVPGATLNWGGIKIADPGGPVTINANWIRFGASGIDMSTATQDLTVQYGDANANETWNVATGRTLTVQNFYRDSGAVSLAGGGNVV
jgi:hypothetical protein